MEKTKSTPITVETLVHAPVETVWEYWIKPEHIMNWNTASKDWFTPSAENDLKAGGKFSWRMEAKDGSNGFDFAGVYDEVRDRELISSTLGDGRKVQVKFIPQGNDTRIVEVFDAEHINAVEPQRAGWQAILTNFKRYVEKEENTKNLLP